MTKDTVVLVRQPQLHENSGGKFTDYEISIRTTNIHFNMAESTVRRRYSEFVWLQKQLQKAHIGDLPELPPKKVFDRFEEDFVEFRRQGLQKFLRGLVSNTDVLYEKCFHMFLQTDERVAEINATVNPMSPNHSEPDSTLSPAIFVVTDPLPGDAFAATMGDGGSRGNRSIAGSVGHSPRSSPIILGKQDSAYGSNASTASAADFSYSSLPSTAGHSPPNATASSTLDDFSSSRTGTPARRRYSPSHVSGGSSRSSPRQATISHAPVRS